MHNQMFGVNSQFCRMGLCSTMMCFFLVLQALLFATTIMQNQYEDHLTETLSSAPVALDFDDLYNFRSPRPGASVDVPLNGNTKFLGSILFINENKTIRCTPKVTFSADVPSTVRLSLGCYEKIPQSLYLYGMEFCLAGMKALTLVLIIFGVIMWTDMSVFPFRPIRLQKRDGRVKARFRIVKDPTDKVVELDPTKLAGEEVKV